jgi:FkbM family methyltransferase
VIEYVRRFYKHGQKNSYVSAIKLTNKIIARKIYKSHLHNFESRVGVSVFLSFLPIFNSIKIQNLEHGFRIENRSLSETYLFPTYPPYWEIRHIDEGYEQYMKTKYTSDSFIDVEDDDTVVDVGAFVGAFSKHAADDANKVFSIEPSRKNYDCLTSNVRSIPNIYPQNIAISNESSNMLLNLSSDPTDHSLIDVDSGDLEEQESINAVTLDEFLDSKSIDRVDFLKIDAEGFEPEVLRSVERIPIHKIAVDCSPERNGETTINQVIDILSSRNYEYKRENSVIFARYSSIE